jgi:hypothetical protein
MFKYAPGMESGLGAAFNMMRKHAEPDGDEETRENPEERQELYNFIHMIKGVSDGMAQTAAR